jgi:predicted nuclease with TOPRIM domain
MAYPFNEPFDFNFNVPQANSRVAGISTMNSEAPNIEQELPELLKHPSVMSLWRQNTALQMSQNKLTDTVSSLQQNNIALQSELRSLTDELSAANQKVSTVMAELQSLQVNANL